MPGKHYPNKAKNPKPKAKKQTFYAKRNDGKTVGTPPPKKYGAYKMYPGKHSEVNPGNFRGSEVRKYSALKMHPMKFEDQKGTSPGITQADVISAKTKGYNPKMYKPKAHHPRNEKDNYDPKQKVEGEVIVTGKRPGPSGKIVTKNGLEYRQIGKNLYPTGRKANK